MNKLNKQQIENFEKPLKLILIYFLLSYILFFFGPVMYNIPNKILLILFLFFSNIFFVIGYKVYLKKYVQKVNKDYSYTKVFYKLKKYFIVLIYINFFMVLFFTIREIGVSTFSFNSIVVKFLSAINNPGKQYNLKFKLIKTFGGNILAPMHTFFSMVLWPMIPLSLFYIKKLSLFNRLVVFFTISIEIIRWISTGTNKGVIDIILIIMSITYLKANIKTNKILGLKRINKINFKKIILYFFLIIIGLYIFEKNIFSRTNGNIGIIRNILKSKIDYENLMIKVLPFKLKPILIYVTGYLTQGYYGLSLALDKKFIPMFGIGNSYFLISKIESIFSTDIFQYTYQARIQNLGWNPFVNWHTAYLWLANDLSFVGVIIFMFFLGQYYIYIYYKSIVNEDPICISLFCLINIGLFYFPLNNQIMSTPSMFMSFIFLNIILIFRKEKISKY